MGKYIHPGLIGFYLTTCCQKLKVLVFRFQDLATHLPDPPAGERLHFALLNSQPPGCPEGTTFSERSLGRCFER